MKKLLACFLLINFAVTVRAQVVQWASKVIEFSSELTPVQYSAHQTLGKPDVLPAGGQNPNAWAPDKPKRREFLKLGFDNAINIRQIAIAESHNPSAVRMVLAYDETGREHVINMLNPAPVPLKGRMLNIFTELTPYKVAAIKIEFDGAVLPDFFQIDAVAITDSRYPIIADIPKPQLLASGILIEPLDKNVNSEYNELNPLLSPDGKTLYFSRSNHPGNVGGINDMEDIWYSQLDSTGHWQLARNMAEFNNAGPNFINTVRSITPDGKSALLVLGNKYEGGDKMVAGVSISTNTNGIWSKPVPLKINNDYNFSDKANFFLANNRKTLILSVEREDTHGDRDLYVSFMQDDSVWTEPLNLGDVVNSASAEIAPFLDTDNKTLYFSSTGFSGYGGNDIYISKRLDDTWTSWSEPENLGPEINSPLEDLYFNIPAHSEFAYYSRGVSKNNLDIFRIKLPIFIEETIWVTVKGKVVDGANGKPLAAKIVYEQLPQGKELGIVQSNTESGEYEIRLPAGYSYGIRAESANKISESQHIDLRNTRDKTVFTDKNFDLEPIKVSDVQKDVTIPLNNVFFDFDKAKLKSDSYPELNRIALLLKEKTAIQIEVVGYTDAVGSPSYNLKLSEKRVHSVIRYLEDQGVDKNRMRAVFFGEKSPLDSNETIEGRKKNRRVEFKILKL